MTFFVVFFGVLFSVFACVILSYISVATMIGPWIAPTIVLVCSILYRVLYRHPIDNQAKKALILTQALASGGGIIAVGVGFGLPILYFLDAPLFTSLLQQPLQFALSVILLCLAAGSLGIFLGNLFAQRLLEKKELSFPISQITYQVATSQTQRHQAMGLLRGILSTLSLCVLRDGIFGWKGIIPKAIPIFHFPIVGCISFALWPTLWAIGYTAGLATALPLLVGLFAKYCVLYPLNHHASFLPWKFFSAFKDETFATAFCAGLVICEVVLFAATQPRALLGYCKAQFLRLSKRPLRLRELFTQLLSGARSSSLLSPTLDKIEPFLAISAFFALFSYLGFPLLAQVAILVATIVACYEMNYISGKIGLLQFGRFSAFILIPMVVLFKISPLQITVLCVFFNVCAAASSDLLFDYKTGDLAGIERGKMHAYQWLGLIIACLCVGFIFYLLFTALPLGSEQLFAHRGRSKALLLQSLHFDVRVLCLGFLFGIVLKRLKISPTMTFGGIIMPSQVTIGFIIGGALSWLVGKKKMTYLPYCSGVFASETLWIVGCIAIKMLFA